ncbi:hypothetical protein Tco_0728483 [Tanacetum coccineum]|uniref:Uncharacterized protein n=1 Tax=Tanacetum coccineum TaxID=301880 RepID=A0ABQ4YM44_9ASTR
MESSSLNSEEMELQQMQLDERELHQKCLALFEKLKKYLGFLHRTQFKEFLIRNRRALLQYLEEVDKLIDERVLKYSALQMKDKEVQVIKEIKNRLKEKEIQQQESLITKGAAIEACLVTKGNENKSSDHESTSSRIDADADIGSSNDSNILLEVYHDLFKNMFAYVIQSHEQPESISDTYEVNENNSNIIFDIPNMDPDKNKEEHDYVDYEQHHALFASLINNLKCDLEKCNEVNREAQQANALLTNELKRYKKKEKHFVKDMTIESEYCKKIKLLNDEISYLKYQACEKDKTFAKENRKFDEYVQPLLNKKNELEKKNQKFLKQINDLDNRLRKAGQTDQTLRMLRPKEENVNTGK